MSSSFLAPVLRRPGPFGLVNRRTGQPLAERLTGAFRSADKRRGLLGHTGLAEGEGLVIPTFAVHTFSMKFPIDVIFVRRDGTVVKIRAAMPAGRMAMKLGAYAVVELGAGEAERRGLKVGDRLEVAG